MKKRKDFILTEERKLQKTMIHRKVEDSSNMLAHMTGRLSGLLIRARELQGASGHNVA